MVTFQIASDLHIEYKTNCKVENLQDYIVPQADVLILAGDIGNLYKYDQLRDFLQRVSVDFSYVLYVPGNHEFYRVPNSDEVLRLPELEDRLHKLEKEVSNLYVLNRGSVCIEDVCVVGCTLWSDAKTNIPPYIVRIPGMGKNNYNNMHRRDLRYLKKMINYCENNHQKLLVVTHHVPTYRVMKGKKSEDRYKSLYATSLDFLLRHDYVHTWVCGHIHRNFDFVTPLGTRLVSNQRGKPKDKITDYDPSMTIEL